jgi:phage gp29-like protein
MASSWKSALGALLGISAYSDATPAQGESLDDAGVEKHRRLFGGQLAPLPQTQTRWYIRDLESAVWQADGGNLAAAARLYRAFRRDGVLEGLLSTRTSGLVALPKRFRGDAKIKEALEARDGAQARSVFDDMFPPSELSLLAADGICLGVGVAELVPVAGRDFPVLVRHDPENLVYRWNENRWYFTSTLGLLPITPGDGRWVLHVPKGRVAPWQNGAWQALGQAWIAKQHAMMHRANYSAKLANPARVAKTVQGTTDVQRAGFLAQLIAWGTNSVFELPPGYDVSLLESRGEGFKVFQEEITTCDNEIMIALAGQTPTVTGGDGFSNQEIHKSIRADLIKETADSLAYTINTQGIPQFVVRRWGLETLERTSAIVEWDVTPPKDVKNEADSLKSFGEAIVSLTAGLTPYGVQIDIASLANRFGIPIAQDKDGDGRPETAAEDIEIDLSELEPVEAPRQVSIASRFAECGRAAVQELNHDEKDEA